MSSPDEWLGEGGDLGLGRGLKPGAMEPPDNDDSLDNTFSMLANTTLPHAKCKRTPPPTNNLATNGDTKHKFDISKLRQKLLRRTSLSKKSKTLSEDEVVDCPTFAEVALGTSLRQQKELYSKQLRELFPELYQDSEAQVVMCAGIGKEAILLNEAGSINQEMLERKLKKAEMEVDLLQQDLDLCQKQLEAKYKAIRIMQKQSQAVQHQQMDVNKWVKQSNKKLIEEMNRLQFEMDHQQSSMMYNQQILAERLDRVCQENSALMATLEARSEEMRKMHAEKMALMREKDELLALLDIQERQRYECTRSMTSSSEDLYSELSSAELAVLGACRCRVRSPEPCGCAHAAAYMKKVINRLRDEGELHKRRREDALLTSDAYRMAFEEQMANNKRLIQKTAELSSLPLKKTDKVKSALRWVINQLNDDDLDLQKKINNDIKKKVIKDGNDLHNSDTQSVSTQIYSESLPDHKLDKADHQNTNVKESSNENEEINDKEENNDSTDVNKSKMKNADVESSADVYIENAEAESQETVLNDAAATLVTAEVENTHSGTEILPAENGVWQKVENMSDQELVTMLIEMINDKSEALAHQRLVARMLASRTQKLEEKLTEYGDDLNWDLHEYPSK